MKVCESGLATYGVEVTAGRVEGREWTGRGGLEVVMMVVARRCLVSCWRRLE